MKQKYQARHKGVLHYALKYLIVRRKTEQAHSKLLLAINNCTSKRELKLMMTFRSLHAEPFVVQLFQKRMIELEQQAA